MNKLEVRKASKALRNSFSQTKVNESSNIISKNILDSSLYKNSERIMCYLSFKNEVSVDRVIETALKDKKHIFVPYILSSTVMSAVEISSLDNLSIDKYGIRSPFNNQNEIKADDLDLVLVPGVAFTMSGCRLGMGAGYYDRFLPKCTNAYICGVVYSDLIEQKLPVDEYDAFMDYIVCEQGIFKASGLERGK